ncbi:putative ubiquitin-specific protease [Naematelia encephala]|uniref:Ubiquitin carboxyl-terminal hydrolase n=1 Tax=Naematelia encephala TaxID=71784 RepID=A0A1Y2AEJ8_9TREE|nr:putative ubiquitin-specific protease [Naematelia encephala]
MSEDPSGWSLTESDPQIFTQLLLGLGVKGLQVDDLYSLDQETLAALSPIHALIFLFKYVGEGEGAERGGVEVDGGESGVWFANQVINNSCGTLAALNAVMNIPPVKSLYPGESIELGAELENLRDFGAGMTPLDLGHVLSSSDLIRETHNSFSKSSPFSLDPSASSSREKEDAYHFVAYIPVTGVLYELDGLRTGAVMHAAVDEGESEGWLAIARDTIEQRIATYPPGSVMFNLLAVRSEAIPRLTRLLKDPSISEGDRLQLQEQLEHELVKKERGRVENALRRNNLLPAVFALLKGLGQSGTMGKILEEARVKGRERKERANKRGEE